MPKILIDKNIPYLAHWIREDFDVASFVSKDLSFDQLTDTDALIVRTLTSVNAQLLKNNPSLAFIASATSGVDHIDLPLLQRHQIAFAHAPGCNAKAVCDYVMACFHTAGSPKKHGRIGIIGCGHVGTRVANAFSALGYDTLCYDPPKSGSDAAFMTASLDDLIDLDALCIHPNLTHDGPYPSKHLLDDTLLSQQDPGTLIINTSRGEVANEQALLKHADKLRLCLDVWQNEPHINLDLMAKTLIATPHIAGYAMQAKWNASKQVTTALYAHFGKIMPSIPAPDLSTSHLLDISAIDQAWRLENDQMKAFKTIRQQQIKRL